ncbi:hypothetical protein [Streptomyces sp. RFCAC02]|uniref:hypothetical protein n=1 Tax=Streptomyces sp. RFCAC02 TaxID=2499143 RepID=UPI001022617F|nr:hypothetical protein [Streptomyces sp. RFCAC02]
MSSAPPTALPRRTLLACGVAAGLAGCTGGDGGGGVTEMEPSAVRGVRRRAARDSAGLLARYDATTAAHPDLDGTLAPFRAVAAAHLTALAEDDPAASVTPDGAPEVPADGAAAVTALADAERTLADERTRALTGLPPELARLLASLAAAGAATAYLLNEVSA